MFSLRKEERRASRESQYALERVQRSKKTPEFITGQDRELALSSNPALQRRLLEEEIKLAGFQRRRQHSIMLRLAEEEARRADKHWRKTSNTIGDVAALPRKGIETALMIAGGVGAGTAVGGYFGKSAVEQIREATSSLGRGINWADVRQHVFVEPVAVRAAVEDRMKKDPTYWQRMSGQSRIPKYEKGVIGTPGWVADEVASVRQMIRFGGRPTPEQVTAAKAAEAAGESSDSAAPLAKKTRRKPPKAEVAQQASYYEDATGITMEATSSPVPSIGKEVPADWNFIMDENGSPKMIGRRRVRDLPSEQRKVYDSLMELQRQNRAASRAANAAEGSMFNAVKEQGNSAEAAQGKSLDDIRAEIRQDAEKRAKKIMAPQYKFEARVGRTVNKIRSKTTIPLAKLSKVAFAEKASGARNIARLKLGGGAIGVAAAVTGGAMLINKIRRDRVDAQIQEVYGVDPSERVRKSWFERRRKYGRSGMGF